MPTLILTPRYTEDAQLLWRAAGKLGWGVERLINWRVTEEVRCSPEPVLYLEALFGPALAEQFGLRLLTPSIDWLPCLPAEYRKRTVTRMTLAAARELPEAAFIKPPNDKSFPASVYKGSDLPTGYDESSPVLVAEVVTWEKEFRCFVLDRQAKTMSIYLRNGELQRSLDYASSADEMDDAEQFVNQVLGDNRVELPRACVIDVGVIAGRGWAVVEQNSAWGAGIYGCDPVEVLRVLQFASEPLS